MGRESGRLRWPGTMVSSLDGEGACERDAGEFADDDGGGSGGDFCGTSGLLEWMVRDRSAAELNREHWWQEPGRVEMRLDVVLGFPVTF